MRIAITLSRREAVYTAEIRLTGDGELVTSAVLGLGGSMARWSATLRLPCREEVYRQVTAMPGDVAVSALRDGFSLTPRPASGPEGGRAREAMKVLGVPLSTSMFSVPESEDLHGPGEAIDGARCSVAVGQEQLMEAIAYSAHPT